MTTAHPNLRVITGGADAPTPDLSLLAINLTERCNLACRHCYLDASTKASGNHEMSTAEVLRLLDDVAAMDCGTMVVLTGGEPLLRPDLERLIAHGAGAGLPMVIGTNGMALTSARVTSLIAAGLLGAGISIDSLDPEKHDQFRGLKGAWAKTMAGIDTCRRQQLSFQIHFSVAEFNADELDDVIAFAKASGARVLNIFFLVCTGRGEHVTDLSPARYEHVLARIIEAQAGSDDLIIRARCAPYFKRIAHQLRPESTLNRISGMDGDGCIAGTHYCRVTPAGKVTPCPYIESACGDLRDTDLPTIWRTAPTLNRLRRPKLGGKCGACEYSRICGGCRARPVALGGGLLDADPWCTYIPSGAPAIPVFTGNQESVSWSAEAEQRLARIPRFLRALVRKRAEAYVQERGISIVLAEHLHQLAARRFGANSPAVRGPD